MYRRIMDSLSKIEDEPLHDVIPEGTIRGEPSALRSHSNGRDNENAGNLVETSVGVHSVKSARRPSLARISNSEEEGLRPVITSSSSASNPELAKQGNPFDVADPVGKNGDSGFSNCTVDAECRKTANTSASFARESVLIEQLIGEYASLLDSSFDLDLVDTRYERPRPVPAVPKRTSSYCTKQHTRFSTRVSTKSEPVSRNFRRLRLDIQHPTRYIHRTQWDQESPDWACQTSLAIEAGTISMGSIHMHGGESTPRHISEVMCGPTKICSPDRRRVQSCGPGEKDVTCPSPFNKHSLTHPAAGRHSEGALQLVRDVNVARLLGTLKGMEVTMREEPLTRGFVEAAPLMDLNKSLPALPLQACEQDGKSWSGPC